MTALLEAYGYVFDRFALVVYESDTKVAQPGPIYHGAPNDIPAFVECEPFGDDVVHHHAPVVEEIDHILAVEPPHGRRVGTDGHPHVLPRR